jgi:hypothetical protein
VAQHIAGSCSVEMPRCVACTAGLGIIPKGFRILRLSRNDSKRTGERCTLAHIDRKKHCRACNKIKLLEKKFGTDRTARDGHARAARCATPQPEQ